MLELDYYWITIININNIKVTIRVIVRITSTALTQSHFFAAICINFITIVIRDIVIILNLYYIHRLMLCSEFITSEQSTIGTSIAFTIHQRQDNIILSSLRQLIWSVKNYLG